LGCRISNAVKCLPPANKPSTAEADECNRYLRAELAGLPAGAAILALGSIAHRAVLRAFDVKLSAYPFGHAHLHVLPAGMSLLDSYHCSRYNTQTKRLSEAMFMQVMTRAKSLAGLG